MLKGLIPAVLISLILSLILTPHAEAGQRVALVVGNAQYSSVSPLSSPGKDAQLMAETLRALGFTLSTVATILMFGNRSWISLSWHSARKREMPTQLCFIFLDTVRRSRAITFYFP